MPLRITFLGTGGAFTDFRVNYHNNALIHTAIGPILIDCGGTAPQALRELGLAPTDLAAVCITHLHGDHVGGLEQIVWERLYGGVDGPSWVTTPVLAAPGVLEDVRRVVEPQVRWHTRPDRSVGEDGWDALVEPRRLVPGEGRAGDGAEVMELGGVRLSLHRTPHVSIVGVGGKPCTGVQVRASDGAALYFTSDTELRRDIGERFPDHAIFHDTTFMPPYEGTVHTHYAELRTLPAEVRRRTVLMHHTRVPGDQDPVADGFAFAADRFDTFQVDPGGRLQRLPTQAALSGQTSSQTR